MRTLVIPDIHQRHVRAQKLIDTVPFDKCILLGDYFDNFADNYYDANNTAIWLRDFVLSDPRIVPLLGNHDTQYFWPYNPTFRCSGYGDMKKDAILKELNRDHIEQFKYFHIDQGFVFVHAGVDNRLWKDLKLNFDEKGDKTKLEFFEEILTYWVNHTKKLIADNKYCSLLGAGWDRGGSQPIGGINWADFSNLSPINGINQIVGHTIHKVPNIKIQKRGGSVCAKTIFEYYEHQEYSPSCKDPLSINYALDTHLNHYMVVDDGKVEIWDYANNMNIRELKNYAIPESLLSGHSGLPIV
jgi:predicted phosphodiesterase